MEMCIPTVELSCVSRILLVILEILWQAFMQDGQSVCVFRFTKFWTLSILHPKN